MEKIIGIIDQDGWVRVADGRKFQIPSRGKDSQGYPEVLIGARGVGGQGPFQRQSIQPFIGMKCSFISNNGSHGYNFEII